MSRKVARSVAVVLAMGALAGAGTARPTSHAAWSASDAAAPTTSQRPRLVFASTRTGIWQLYTYGATPGGLRQLTFDRPPDRRWWDWARVAPDGHAVAALAYRLTIGAPTGVRYPSMLGPSGKEIGLVDDVSDFPDEPWSPDGSRLAVYQGRSRQRPSCGTVAVLHRSSQSRVARAFRGRRSSHVAWSPDGRQLVGVVLASIDDDDGYCARNEAGDVVISPVVPGQRRTLIAGIALSADPAWSPDGRLLAIVQRTGTSGVVRVVAAHGGAEARTVSRTGVSTAARWSPAGGWIAFVRNGAVELVRPDGSGRRVILRAQPGCDRCVPLIRWSPDGKALAIAGSAGLRVYRTAAGSLRPLTTEAVGDLSWAPSSAEIAYEATGQSALRVVSLTGRARTLVTGTGDIASLQWAAAPAGSGAKKPSAVEPLVQPAGHELRLRRSVDDLVANGDQVALGLCGDVVQTWQPTTGARAELLPTWVPPAMRNSPYACWGAGPDWGVNICHFTEDLALSDLGLGYLYGNGCAGRSWSLNLLAPRGASSEIASWTGGHGGAGPTLIGWTRGAGDLLVFAAWDRIWRAHETGYPGTCPSGRLERETAPGPCERLATEPGRFMPYDVAEDRIVAADDNAIVLLDETGNRLRTIPVHALAAALSGDELVVLSTGEISHFSASTGQLLHVWPRPEVTEGTCSTDPERWWDMDDCLDPRVEGVDTARGLAALTIDGRIHLIRLTDGTDTVLTPGTIARFTTTGLVYATSAADPTYPWRLVHLPNDQLP